MAITTTISKTTKEFKDIDLSFGVNPITKDISIKKNDAAVKNSIKNLVLTRNFDIPFHPEQGCQAYAMMFELMNPITAEIIRNSVVSVIKQYEPRVQLLEVIVDPNPDANAYSVTVYFKIIGSTVPTQVTIVLERAR